MKLAKTLFFSFIISAILWWFCCFFWLYVIFIASENDSWQKHSQPYLSGGASEWTFLIFAFIFPDFSSFSQFFFLIFSLVFQIFGNFSAVKWAICPPLPQYRLRYWFMSVSDQKISWPVPLIAVVNGSSSGSRQLSLFRTTETDINSWVLKSSLTFYQISPFSSTVHNLGLRLTHFYLNYNKFLCQEFL